MTIILQNTLTGEFFKGFEVHEGQPDQFTWTDYAAFAAKYAEDDADRVQANHPTLAAVTSQKVLLTAV